MEKYILLKCIILLIFNSLTSSTEIPPENDPAGCFKSELYDEQEADIGIIDEVNNKLGDNLFKHGTTSIVTCKSNNIQTFKVCRSGKWHGDNVCDIKPRKLSRHKRWFWIFIPVFGCLFTRCSRSPAPLPRDRTKPVLVCPNNIIKPADPLQIITKVTWVEPQARDDKDGYVNDEGVDIWDIVEAVSRAKTGNRTTRTGPKPGSMFSEGRYNVIKYHARDNSGNIATCSFRIIITVARCPNLNRVNNGYYICHPSDDMRNGGSCRFGCYEGHTLQGVSRSWCQGNSGYIGKWSGWSLVQPYCKKKTCDPLFPTSSLQNITCTDNYNFRSVCRFTCASGYDIPPGSVRVMVCQADQTWRGLQPTCVDVSPPVFTKNTCPHSVTFYTDRGTNTAQVYWSQPSVSDNSGGTIHPVQQSGPSSLSVLQHGVYTVIYSATDNAGNHAEPCVMKIIVKHILCWTVYPTPYSSVSCPAGTGYGQNCHFDCSAGTKLNGSSTVTCEKTGNPPYGLWSWGSYQPFCQLEKKCEDLTPPARGALSCDVWFGGKFCHPLCQDGYDVPPGSAFPNLLVCGDSGSWSKSTKLSDCKAAIPSRRIMVHLYFYYRGHCAETSVQSEIKKKFIEAISNSAFKFYCLNEPKCTYHNIKVKCGSTRRKRETSKKFKRSTNEIEITLAVERSNSIDLDTYQFNTEINEFNKFVEDTQNDVSTGTYDIELQSGKLKPSTLEAGELELKCDNNSVPSYPSLKCVNCSAGTYYTTSDRNKAICTPCGRGYYQPSEGQDTCIKCPTGQSTEDEKSNSSLQCIDACTPGTWSSTSLPPCSKCPVGTFQKNYGGTNCISCPAGTTTSDEGSVSVNSCQESDIVFEEDETGNAPTAISMRMNDRAHIGIYYFVFRSRCSGACVGDVVSVVDDSGTTQVNLTNDQYTTLTIKGSSKQSSFSPVTEQWYGYVLAVTYNESRLYVDETLVAVVPMTSDSIGPTSRILIGGNGFTGSVSQFNIFTNTFDIAQIKQFASKCSNSEQGNWLHWNHVQNIELQNAYLQIPSQCDDFNECLSNPCVHGHCKDKLDSYQCSCDPGFTNTTCDVNIDDCVAHICQNAADCVDGVEAYTCKCKHGFTGELCEVAVVDGGWTGWGNWSECSTTCGPGFRLRKRTCSNPSPDNGGRECVGNYNDSENCNLQLCPSCDTSILSSIVENGNFSCTYNVTTDLYVCEIECNDGYMFDHVPADNYTCGNSTLYLWDYMTDDNPNGVLPKCIPMVAPDEVFVTHSALYQSLDCTSNNANKAKTSVLNTVSSAVNDLSCIKNKTCTKGDIQVTNCNSNRRKRDTSIDTAGFNLKLLCDSKTYGTEQCYFSLTRAIREILGMESAEQLTTEVDAVNYIILANSSSSNDEVNCPENTVKFYTYCVPCGKGRYFKGGNCENCPVGTYQDELQQSTCKNCSKGTTTNDTGSTSIDDCNVAVEVYTSDIETDNIDNPELKTKLIIGIVMGVIVVIAILVALTFCIRKHYRSKSREGDKGSVFSLNMIHVAEGPTKISFDTNKLQDSDLNVKTVS